MFVLRSSFTPCRGSTCSAGLAVQCPKAYLTGGGRRVALGFRAPHDVPTCAYCFALILWLWPPPDLSPAPTSGSVADLIGRMPAAFWLVRNQLSWLETVSDFLLSNLPRARIDPTVPVGGLALGNNSRACLQPYLACLAAVVS